MCVDFVGVTWPIWEVVSFVLLRMKGPVEVVLADELLLLPAIIVFLSVFLVSDRKSVV